MAAPFSSTALGVGDQAHRRPEVCRVTMPSISCFVLVVFSVALATTIGVTDSRTIDNRLVAAAEGELVCLTNNIIVTHSAILSL